MLGYKTSRGGSGLVQPALSTKTQAVAFSEKGLGVSLNFGYAELKEDFSKTLTLKIENLSPHSGTFNISSALPSGSPHSVVVRRDVLRRVRREHSLRRRDPEGASRDGGCLERCRSLVQRGRRSRLVTPQGSEFNSGINLRVPYYLVPRALSDIKTKLGSKLKPSNPTTTANITNEDGVIAGDADFYAWGLSDGKEPGKAVNDVRAIGVQSFPFNATNQFIGFSVNTYDRWSNPSTNEYDISVDVDNDGKDDYIVVGADQGAIQTGTFNGRLGSFVFSTRSAGASINFFAQAPTDSAAANIFILSSQLCRGDNPATPAVDPEPCLNAANPRFTYSAVSFDVTETAPPDEVEGSAKYNAWSPSISTGGFQTVAPGGTAQETIAVNATEWALTPALGLMITTVDNKSKNGGEAQTIPVDFK